jgi:tetratricopeptide (TPR) repeat protein
MSDLLPQAYLLGLIALLAGAAFVVGRQILRVRRDEMSLTRLGGEGGPKPSDAAGLYELASVQLRKRLYSQAADTLKQAVKLADSEKAPPEARAVIENALGFALAAQNKYPAAIKHYQTAIRCKADYPVALNNLAFALGKLQRPEEARSTYEQVLNLEPDNKTASKGLKTLKRRSGIDSKSA